MSRYPQVRRAWSVGSTLCICCHSQLILHRGQGAATPLPLTLNHPPTWDCLSLSQSTLSVQPAWGSRRWTRHAPFRQVLCFPQTLPISAALFSSAVAGQGNAHPLGRLQHTFAGGRAQREKSSLGGSGTDRPHWGRNKGWKSERDFPNS